MDQPGKVANPARGQLTRKSVFSSVPVRDGFSRPAQRQPAHSPHSGRIWCLLTGFLPLSAVVSFNLLVMTPTAIGSVPSLSDHAIAY